MWRENNPCRRLYSLFESHMRLGEVRMMFVLGLVLGGVIGVIAMAALVVASDADDGMGID